MDYAQYSKTFKNQYFYWIKGKNMICLGILSKAKLPLQPRNLGRPTMFSNVLFNKPQFLELRECIIKGDIYKNISGCYSICLN